MMEWDYEIADAIKADIRPLLQRAMRRERRISVGDLLDEIGDKDTCHWLMFIGLEVVVGDLLREDWARGADFRLAPPREALEK
jgi:hypothetical protein